METYNQMSKIKDENFRKMCFQIIEILSFEEEKSNLDKELDEEKLKKCSIVITEFLQTVSLEGIDTIQQFIQKLIREQKESSIIISTLVLSKIIEKEKTQMTFIVEFVNSLLTNVRCIKKKAQIDFISNFFDIILSRFGDGIIEIVTRHNAIFMKEIFTNTGSFPIRRYLAYSLLNQILKQKQYLIWKELKNFDLSCLFTNVMNEEWQNKSISIAFLAEMMKFISKLDKEEQRHYFSGLAMSLISQSKEQKSKAFFMNFNFIYRYIYGYLNKSFFSKEQLVQVLDASVENVRQSFEKKDSIINKYACQMIPEMISYNTTLIIEKKHLQTILNVLYDQIQMTNNISWSFYNDMFAVVTQIFTVFSSEVLTPFLQKFAIIIIELLLWTWKTAKKSDSESIEVTEILVCFHLCLKTLKNIDFLNKEKLEKFVENSLVFCFNNNTIEVLEILHKIADKEFRDALEDKLKITICVILKKEIEDFEDEVEEIFANQSIQISEKDDFVREIELADFHFPTQKNGSPKNAVGTFFTRDGMHERESFDEDNDLSNSQFKTLLFRTKTKAPKRSAINNLAQFSQNASKKKELDRFIDIVRLRFSIDAKRTSKESIPNEKNISVALEALARFDFGSRSNQKRKNFIKDTVFVYLKSQSIELRRKAARIVFILIPNKNDSNQFNEETLSDESVQKIIEKIMSIAIGDPDDQVRIDILTALNNRMCTYFIPFLLNEDSLRQLILMVNDFNPKIQKQSILLLQKLIPSYPELLARFDQIIFVASSFLMNNKQHSSIKSKNYVKLLDVIAKHSQFLIKSRLSVLIPILIDNLETCLKLFFRKKDERFNVDFFRSAVKCLGHCISYQPDFARRNFEKCCGLLIPNFFQFNEETLAEVIKFFCILTRNSGFQLILLIKFDMFRILLEILETSSILKLRLHTLRLLGTIGAIDPVIDRQIHDVLKKSSREQNTNDQNFLIVLEKIRKNAFNFEKFIGFGDDLLKNPMYLEYDDFVNEVYLTQKDSQAVLYRHIARISPIKHEESVEMIEKRIQKQIFSQKNQLEKESLVNFNEKIQNENYLFGYIVHQTINVLFDTINNSLEETLALECLESLQQIILVLGRFIFDFKLIVLSPLLEVFKTSPSKNIKIICVQNLKYFAKAAGKILVDDKKCVSKLMKLLLNNFENNFIQKDLFVICRLLVKNKTSLPYRFKDIVLTLLGILNKNPEHSCVEEIFEVILCLNNNDYYYLITPALIEMFPKKTELHTKLTSEDLIIVDRILRYLTNILQTKHFENHFGNIVRAVIKLMSDFSELKTNLSIFLVEVIKVFGDRCSNYVPLIGPLIKDSNEFHKMVQSLEEKGYIETKKDLSEIELESTMSDDQNIGDEERTLRTHSIREGNYDLIKDYFLINNFNKSDFNWNDWFTRLKLELISSSYSTVLIACKNLRFYKGVMDKLFKPAFVMFWSQLTSHQKSQITRGLDTIISNTTKIQASIRKKILELIEFMSHRNEFGIALNISKLAEFAVNCHNPPNAIFFKELEFQTNPQNAIEALVNLYCEVGYKYAAEGLLEYAQNDLEITVKEDWLQLLGKWDLKQESSNSENKDSPIMQVFSTVASSNWESALHKIKDVMSVPMNKQIEQTLAEYRAKASFHLGKWDILKKCVNEIGQEKDFYKSILLGNEGNLPEAIDQINEEIKIIEKNMQNFSNYTSNYEKFVKLQKYVEMENIFAIKHHYNLLEKNELYNYLISKEEQAEERNKFEKHTLDVWEDKLSCMEKNIDFWQEILAMRNLLCSKNKMLPSYLRLSNLCYLNDNPQLFTRILTILKKEISSNEALDVLLELAEIECNYKTSKIQQKQVITKIEELFVKRNMVKNQTRMLYKKIGPWILKSEGSSDVKDERVVKFFEMFLGDVKDDSRLWHYFGIANYQMIKDIDRSKIDGSVKFLINAFQGFTHSISFESKFNSKYIIQDLLRFLELWYEYHDFKNEKITEIIDKSVAQIPNKHWVLIVRQIISRLEQKSSFSNAIKNLLSALVKEFPQYLVFPLLLAKKSDNETKVRMITKVLRQLEEGHRTLVQEATNFSDELIRISILLEEIWTQAYPELYRYKVENNIQKVVEILNRLLDLTSLRKGSSSIDEIAFFQRFGAEIKQARNFLELFENNQNELFFNQTWDIFCNIISDMESSMKSDTDFLYLENVSPELYQLKNLLLCVPGTLKRDTSKQKDIRIVQIHGVLKVLKSKRRPRKITLYGSDAKEYSFLLKGNEDLRLDERVMQLLNMINDLLKPNASMTNQSIKITTFNVLPLSYSCGIISWLDGRDTVFDMIRTFRSKIGIPIDCEREIAREFHDNYNILPKIKKLEVFKYVCQNTKGEDLKNIFWLRSSSADVWLTNRNNYICSLAVMSIVGYILGLGDRHLMNIMIERSTGKIVHIDFSDCFESASLRERLPEKVPFRLTRVLVKAMEACGIEGTFRRVCETVMNILRGNKDVILTVLEEFICDPLLAWKLAEKKIILEANFHQEIIGKSIRIEESKLNENSQVTIEKQSIANDLILRKDPTLIHDDHMNISKGNAILKNFTSEQNLNEKAIQALKSIVNKLSGKDFENIESDYKVQVRRLIRQATSPENVSQAFTGWNPFL